MQSPMVGERWETATPQQPAGPGTARESVLTSSELAALYLGSYSMSIIQTIFLTLVARVAWHDLLLDS